MTARLDIITSASWRCAVALALLVGLAACSSTSDVVDKFLGKDDDTPLPGKREAVLDAGALEANSAQASDPIAIPAAVTNSSWAQPGGVPSHALHNLALSRQVKRAFSISAGKGSDSDGRLTASPIVFGGRVFVLDSQASVRAFSGQNGAKIWAVSLVPDGKDGEGAFGGGLASDGINLYATTAFGEVVALEPGSGRQIWRRQFDLPIRAAPTVADGRIFFTQINNEVHALSTTDGSEIWRYQGSGEQASIIASTSPAVADGFVVVPLTTGDILTFRSSDGLFTWTENLSGGTAFSSLATLNDVAGRPVIASGTVLAIAHSGRMAAFKLDSGQQVWSQELPGTQTPWVAGDYAFVVVDRNKIAAVSRRNGAVRWWAKLPDGGVWSGPVVGGGRLIAVSSKGLMAEVSPQTGGLMNKRDLGAEVFIPPVIANGTIYILADNGSLIALR